MKHKPAPYSNEHLEMANALVQSARIFSIGIYSPMLDKYPEVVSVANSNLLAFWDYLITIASVGSAFMEIADTVPENEQVGIAYAVQEKLNDWHPGSYDAMVDFVKYAKALVDSGVEVPDAIGGWIWVNLEKHDQASLELKELACSLKLVRAIGAPILLTFHGWWKQKWHKA